MKKFSVLGGGEFEYCPHRLEEKVIERAEYINSAYEIISDHLDDMCLDYQKQGLGTFEGIRKELVKRIVLSMR